MKAIRRRFCRSYSRNIISGTFGTCKDQTFAIFVIHYFLKVLDESIESVSEGPNYENARIIYLSRLS